MLTSDAERRTGALDECIRLPLDIAGMVVLAPALGGLVAEVLEVDVQYRTAGMACPACGRWTAKVHDRRPQRKRDVPVREVPVTLVLWRRPA